MISFYQIKTLIESKEMNPDTSSEHSVSSSNANNSNNNDDVNNKENQFTLQKCFFYQKELPKVGDKVAFEYHLLEKTLVRIKLVEYKDCLASILLSELTRKKSVSSYQQLCPIGKLAVAEVISIDTNHGIPYIFCSIKSLTPSDITSYMEYYQKSKKLLGFIRKISYLSHTDLSELCQNLLGPLYQQTLNDQQHHPLDYINHPDKLKMISQPSDLSENIATSASSATCANTSASTNMNDEIDSIATETNMVLTNDNLLNDEKDTVKNKEKMNNKDTDTDTPQFVLDKKYVDLMIKYHELFFGKQEITINIRFGLLSYQMNGVNQIKKILTDTLSLIPDSIVSSLIIRDLPIYEIRLRCNDQEIIQQIKTKIITHLTQQATEGGLLFRLLDK